LSYIIDQRRLLFWRSLYKSDNSVLTLAYFNQNQFIAVASKYGIVNYSLDVKAAIWSSFSNSVLYYCLFCNSRFYSVYCVHCVYSICFCAA